MSEIKRPDYPALYENGKGQYTIVPDWRSGPVGFFRSKKSLEEHEAELAEAQAKAIMASELADAKRAERAREEGAAVRAAIEAREKNAREALARRKAAEQPEITPNDPPPPLAERVPAANPLAGFFKVSE
jgi:hypothetical protein